MKAVTFILIALFSPGYSNAQDTAHVLFVGNSLTYFNDMPQTLQKMFDEQHIPIKVSQATRPGVGLVDHATHIYENNVGQLPSNGETPETVGKILSSKWDIIILQEAPRGVLIPEEQKYGFEPAVYKLDSLIKSVKAKTVLFQIFSGKDYPARYCQQGGSDFLNKAVFNSLLLSNIPDNEIKDKYCSDSFRNSTEEFQVLKKAFDNVAKEIKADIVPVGNVFELIKSKYPLLPVYGRDFHPSRLGSYLIACVFYKQLSGKSLQHVTYNPGLDSGQAATIRSFVETVN